MSLLDLDAGALDVVASFLDAASVVRLGASCRDARHALFGSGENSRAWAAVAAHLGATDAAGRPWLPRGRPTQDSPLPRAPSAAAAARAFAPLVAGSQGAAVARSLAALRCALHALSPALAATLGQGSDDGGAGQGTDGGAGQGTDGGDAPALWGDAARTYVALCDGQACSMPGPDMDDDVDLVTDFTGCLWMGDVYDQIIAGRLLPLTRVPLAAADDGGTALVAGPSWAATAAMHEAGVPAAERLDVDRAFVVASRDAAAPVFQTTLVELSAASRGGRRRRYSRVPAAPSLAAWLAALADQIAAGRRCVVPTPDWLPHLVGPLPRSAPPSLDAFAKGAIAVTRGLCVCVSVLATHVALDRGAVVFSYKITMWLPLPTDQGAADVGHALARARLATRRWDTLAPDGRKLSPTVEGPGVIGLFPELTAGDPVDGMVGAFAYCSRTIHPAAAVVGVGRARGQPADIFTGAFTFDGTTVAGERVRFEAAVPAVELALPEILL